MSHRYRRKTPTTRMYRHFAVVTVAVTGLLAVFAEGENAEAIAQRGQAELLQDQAAPAGSEKEQPPKPDAQTAPGSWGSETGSSSATTSFGTGSAVSPSEWPRLAHGGHSPDYLSALGEEERLALEAAVAESTGGSPSEYRAMTGRLEAASRVRSGSAGRD